MAPPVKVNYKIYQGSTFKEVLRWESPVVVYKPITGITKAAPTVITSTAHGMPAGWRFKVTDVAGMKEINSSTDYKVAASVSANDITLELNSVSYTAYTSGGIIEYRQPVSLVGYTARMQLRSTVSSADIIVELTTENGGIVLDTANSTITLLISATQTQSFSFASAVYSLEMMKAGEVTQLVTGNISLEKEVTR